MLKSVICEEIMAVLHKCDLNFMSWLQYAVNHFPSKCSIYLYNDTMWYFHKIKIKGITKVQRVQKKQHFTA